MSPGREADGLTSVRIHNCKASFEDTATDRGKRWLGVRRLAITIEPEIPDPLRGLLVQLQRLDEIENRAGQETGAAGSPDKLSEPPRPDPAMEPQHPKAS